MSQRNSNRGVASSPGRTKAYSNWDYWGKPVPGYGSKKAKIMIFIFLFSLFLRGSKERRAPQDNEQVSEPGRLGGGRGGVNPPPGACLEVWEDWRVL